MKDVTKIFLASDHAGFYVKEKLKKFLDKKEISYNDFGPMELSPNDDYPDFALKVAQRVARNKCYKGILICGSGIGTCIAANKVRGIRAAAVYDKFTAKMSREHNDANVLCLRGKKFSFRKTRKLVDIWLKTKFSGEERHKRRIKKIEEYER